jgi:nucleoside-diphosphate-sugar epimerase
MRVFVTGATGFIGMNVALALRRAGHEVWGMIRSEESRAKLARHEIHSVMGTMESPATYLSAAEKCSVMIHAASDQGSDRVNLDRQAIDALLSCGARGARPKTLIYTSGVWVYGNTGDRLVDESTPPAPAELVAWRPAHESLVLNASDVRGLVVRPGCVYGRQGSLTGQWFTGPSEGKSPLVIGDGRQRWAMIHVDDLAHGYLRLAESGRSGEIFNFTDRSRATVGEMASAVARAAGYSGPVTHTSLDEARTRMGAFADCLALDQHVDSRKAVRMLGWQPRHGGFLDLVDTYYAAWKTYQK